MDRTQYKTAQIKVCSEWDSIKQMWRPVAAVSYIKSGTISDKQIYSDENFFPNIEEANAHARTWAERWVD